MIRLLFICVALPLFSHGIKDHLLLGQSGDYAVFQQGKMVSLLHIRSLEKNELVMEEISLPSYEASKIKNWQNWVNKGAQGSTSWVVFAMDLQEEELLEAFSYTKGAFLQILEADTFFTKLSKLSLQKMTKENRRKIGPEPAEEEKDRRALWKPKMVFEGKTKTGPFAVYSCQWPKDNSLLSEKFLELYFASTWRFPFPFWVQIRAEHGSVYAKIIDSGCNFQTPLPHFPKRSPRFLTNLVERKNYYEIDVFCPKYYQEFSLFHPDGKGKLQKLTFEKISLGKERWKIRILQKDLKKMPSCISLFPEKNAQAVCTFIPKL